MRIKQYNFGSDRGHPLANRPYGGVPAVPLNPKEGPTPGCSAYRSQPRDPTDRRSVRTLTGIRSSGSLLLSTIWMPMMTAMNKMTRKLATISQFGASHYFYRFVDHRPRDGTAIASVTSD